jgi:hypothetical protein
MENTYEIKYNKAFPIIMIISSIFILGVSFLVGLSVNTITGIILLLIGILMYRNPIVVISQNEIAINNLWGMTLKTHTYSENEISFKDNNLYLNDKKIASSFVAAINQEEIMDFIKKNK